MSLYDELKWRGLVYDATEGVREVLARERVVGYIGFDPTAASLHVGSLLVMMALAHMQRQGHSPIALVGGGTGLIGDPSGKTAERQLLTLDRVEENVEGIRSQLARFLDFDGAPNPARLVNNADWLTKLGAIEFMRDVGKHFTVNAMLAKESVKRRTESEDGISYTEFSYSLLQAYDYLVLHDRFGCTLQMGGSDQWGNITAGMDLIRRVRGGKAHGLVMPLVTTASGTKFGKTEAGTIWLDPALRSANSKWQPRASRNSVMRSARWRARSRSSCTAQQRCTKRRAQRRSCSRAISDRCPKASCFRCSAASRRRRRRIDPRGGW